MRVSRLDKNQSPVLEGWFNQVPDGATDKATPVEQGRAEQPLGDLTPHCTHRVAACDDDAAHVQEPILREGSEEPTPGVTRAVEDVLVAPSPSTHRVEDGSVAATSMTVVALSTLFWAPMAWLVNWIC